MRKSRSYDKEFKKDAVQLALKDNVTIKGVAEDLGIPNSTLRYWLFFYGFSGEFDTKNGGGTQIRTGDTLIFSQVLYRLSYPAT